MRAYAAMLGIILSTAPAWATPANFVLPVQARLLDGNDQPVSGLVRVTISLYDVAEDPVVGAPATPLWSEAYDVHVAAGTFALGLGETSNGKRVLPSSLFASGAPRYVGFAIVGLGELRPRTRVGTVPNALFAFHASDADTVGGETPAQLHDAARLTGTLPAAVVPVLTTLGTVSSGRWEASPVDDAFVSGASRWNAKLGQVTRSALLSGDGTAANPLGIVLGTTTGTVAAGDDARFGSLATAVTQSLTDAKTYTDQQLATRLTIDASGTAAPFRFGNDPSSCTASKAGAIRWTGTAFEGCNGTAWNPLVAAIPGSSASNPAITCKALLTAGQMESKLYWLDPDGGGSISPFQAWCDQSGDGGGWTLVEVGRNVGTGLRTRNAVGSLTNPNQSTSAKLSRSTAAAVAVAGDKILRLGHASYGFLYTRALQNSWLTDGYGSVGYGTIVTANITSLSVAGTTYPGSRLAWPLDGMPAICLNSDNGSTECGNGLHIGTWGSNAADSAYVNGAGASNANSTVYEVWVR